MEQFVMLTSPECFINRSSFLALERERLKSSRQISDEWTILEDFLLREGIRVRRNASTAARSLHRSQDVISKIDKTPSES
jgi:hypothetical protein